MFQLLVGTNIPFMKYRRVAYWSRARLILATVGLAGGARRPPLQRRLHRRHAAPDPHQPGAARPTSCARRSTPPGSSGVELQQMTGENRNEFIIRLRPSQDTRPVPGDVAGASPAQLPGRDASSCAAPRRWDPRSAASCGRRRSGRCSTSLGAILLYVGVRYEFKFALGAVVALFHDVFVTLGVLCFTNREISLTVVAALLTIAGFSINDTIVVFDRIRERHQGAAQGEALARDGHRGQRDAVAHHHHQLHRVPHGARPARLGRRRAARLLVRDRARDAVRHLLLGLRWRARWRSTSGSSSTAARASRRS